MGEQLQVGSYGLPADAFERYRPAFVDEGLELSAVEVPVAFLLALRAARTCGALVIVLTGFEVCRTIREASSIYLRDSPIVALVSPPTRENLLIARTAGADMTVDLTLPARSLVCVVRYALTSSPSLRASAPAELSVGMGFGLSPHQVCWLRDLATGRPIADLAVKRYQSRRSAHRSLADLYETLDVSGRAEAVVWAEQHGVLSGDELWPVARGQSG